MESSIIEITASRQELSEAGVLSSMAARSTGQKVMAFIKKIRSGKGFENVAMFEGFMLDSDLFKIVPRGCSTLKERWS